MKRSNFKLFGLLVALFACVTLLASCSMLNAKVTMHIQGSEVQVVNATYGEKYELPELQNRDLYLFEGWYDNSELAGEPIVEVIVGENTHVWAKWNLLTNVKGISVKAAPTKQAYTAFEKFNPEGLVVFAVCEDGSEYEIGNHLLSFDKSELKVTDKKVVISWEEYTTEVEVSVQKASFDLSSIRFADKAVIYNGKAQSINYTGLLPKGLKAEVKGEGVNVGEYDIELVFSVEDEANYNVPENLSAVLKVEQATFDVSGVELESDEVIYDGEEHTLSYKGELPEGVEATVSKHVNAGTHTVTLTFTHENPNYKQIPAKTGTLVINKADYEFDVEWDYTAAFTYNPEKEHTVLLKSELPEGVELVGYTGNTGKNAGDYTAVATFKSTNPNYNDPKEVSLDWTINKYKPIYDVTGTYTGVYGTKLGDIKLPEVPYGYYEWASPENIFPVGGGYSGIKFTATDPNYESYTSAASYEITPATYDMSKVKWDYLMPFANDGETKVVSVTGLPEGVTVKEYVNASASATGKYTASVVFEYDEDNYYEPTCEDLNWEIKDIISIAEAIEIGSKKANNTYTTEKYYVEGIVTKIASTTYGNIYIQDTLGNELYIYGLYTTTNGTTDGTRYDKMSDKPVVGDKILVYTVLGSYSGAAQGKNAWLIEQSEPTVAEKVAIAANNVAVSDTASEDFTLPSSGLFGSTISWEAPENSQIVIEGNTAKVTRTGETVEVVLTATLKIGDNTVKKEFTVTVPFATKVGATFEFGANGTATHTDGTSATTYSEQDGLYKLSITNGTKLYKNARDAKGNSAIKLGTSSAAGSFKFTVSEDVKFVVIYVAKYKTNTTKIKVNDVSYTISNASNNGQYDEIIVDTQTTKTVTFTTVSGGYRAMINTIEFLVPDVPSEGPTDEEIVAVDKEGLVISSTVLEGNITLPVEGENGSIITWASDNTNLVSINNTTGAATVTKSEQNAAVKLTATISYNEVTETKEFALTVITNKTDLTITEANSTALLFAHNTYSSNKYYAEGTVKSIANTTYGNLYIEDGEGNQLYVYGLYSEDGEIRFDELTTKPVVGDKIKVYGVLGTYNETAQMKSAWLIEIVDDETPTEPTDAESVALDKEALELESTNATTGINLPSAGENGSTITWESDNAAIVIEDGVAKITRPAAGSEDATVTLKATITKGESSDTKEFTVTVEAEEQTSGGEETSTIVEIDFSKNFSTYASSWSNSYASKTLNPNDLGASNGNFTVTLSNVSKQSGTITNMPVLASKSSAAQYVTFKVDSGSIEEISFELQQWTTKKFKTLTLEYSTNGGTSWTATNVGLVNGSASLASAYSPLSITSLPEGVNAVRLVVLGSTTSNNQVGIYKITATTK